MAKERNSAYFQNRIRRDHPAIFADQLAGKYKTVRQAAIAAGLIRLPSRVDVLKRGWKKATHAERSQFAHWVNAEIAKMRRRASAPIADSEGKLHPGVVSFILRWLASKGVRPAEIMKELGLSGFDTTLAAAVGQGERVRKDVIDRLGPWLIKNGYR